MVKAWVTQNRGPWGDVVKFMSAFNRDWSILTVHCQYGNYTRVTPSQNKGVRKPYSATYWGKGNSSNTN